MQQATQEARVGRLIDLQGEQVDSELRVGGHRVSELAEAYSTPFYVYNGGVLEGQVQRLRAALGPETDIYYSLKANPSLGLCQLIARQGLGAEVASAGELLTAQKAGFAPRDTIFAGPGKTDEELRLAVRLSIEAVNVESQGELERLGRIAEAAGTTMGVGLRINPALPVTGANMRMGGGPQQFGIDEARIGEVVDLVTRHANLRLKGTHVYVGTQMFDAEAVAGHFRHVVELSRSVANRFGGSLEMIDFGGGFGVSYFEGTPEFDLVGFGGLYRDVVDTCRADPLLGPARLIVELGRYLVAEAGIYVTRVVDVKESGGRTFVVTDGGMNHHITATGNFGQVFRKPYPVALLNRIDAPVQSPKTLVGPCCTPLDLIARDLPFPAVSVGDLVGIFCSGAYGYSASSLGFLSHPTPAEILVWQGKAFELRPAGRPEDVLDGQNPLP